MYLDLLKGELYNLTLFDFYKKIALKLNNFRIKIKNFDGDNIDCCLIILVNNGDIVWNKETFNRLAFRYIKPEIKFVDDIYDAVRCIYEVYIDWDRGVNMDMKTGDICYTDTDRIWSDGPFLKPPLGSMWNLRPSIPVDIVDYCKSDAISIATLEAFKYNYNPNPCYDPEKIYARDPYTIIIWRDGTKTKVKCQNGEPYDLEKGIAMCYMKKVNGNKPKYYDIFKTAKKKGVLKDD